MFPTVSREKGVFRNMLPYVALIFIPILFSFVAFGMKSNRNRRSIVLNIGRNPGVKNNSLMIPVFFLLLILLLAFRHESIGRDLGRYKLYFNYDITLNFEEIFQEGLDTLYVLLNWLVGRVTDNYQIFLAVIALMSVLPIAFVYGQDREYSFLKIVLFMNMSNFVMLFSGLRQSIAMAMGIIAYEFMRRKKRFWFIMFAVIALGFHHSAFMVFLYYPLYYITFKKKHLWFVIPTIATVFIFNGQIFTILTSIINRFSKEEYVGSIGGTGAYTMIFLFVLFAVFSYIIPDEKKMDRDTLGLRNFLLMAVILQCFALVNNLAMRMNYYFIIFIPILIPRILKYSKTNMRNIAQLARYVMIIFFMLYYLVNTYISCRTGISYLDTYPYQFFWEQI